MNVLTLETTCDETAAAIVSDRLEVLASVVASQDDLHERFGGVVPEIASRAHVERILPVIDEALRQAGMTLDDLDAVAVANTPGLAGSLLVGLVAAKTLCVARGLPLVAVNHLQAHIYACRFGTEWSGGMTRGPGFRGQGSGVVAEDGAVEDRASDSRSPAGPSPPAIRLSSPKDIFPCVGLIISGGHTGLYRCVGPLEFELLGATIDDAAGEAFDKVAAMLSLPYPGGPSIERAAKAGHPGAYRFPRATLGGSLDFSFSGLKTAVRYQIVGPGKTDFAKIKLADSEVADLAASFQEAVVDSLVDKAMEALRQTRMRILCVGGGVAANSRLRRRLAEEATRRHIELRIAPPKLCTDNAVMGAIAVERLGAGLLEDLDLDIAPGVVRR